MEVKHCTKCGELKSLDLFSKNKNKKYGVQPMCKECFRNYYIKNKEKYSIKSREWAANNPDKVKEKIDRYKRNHPDRVKETQKRYRANNRLNSLERYKKYNRENRDKRRLLEQSRRARIMSSNGKLSIGLRNKLLKLQKGKCPCCKGKLGCDFHMDHIMPLSLGGLNIDENIQLLCKSCNLSKGAKHPIDYMQSIGKLL